MIKADESANLSVKASGNIATKNQVLLTSSLTNSRGVKTYLVGECKFKNSPFSYPEYLDTAAKLTPLKEKAEFYYALFSAFGFDEKIRDEASKKLRLYDLKAIVDFERYY